MRSAAPAWSAWRAIATPSLASWPANASVPALYPERIDIAFGDTIVASHARLSNYGQVRYDWQHYIPLIERKPGALRNGAPFADLPVPLLRLRSSLLKREGGDRLMAHVLSCVPLHGLEPVLVAVELVLESGVINTEHIENVLSRPNAYPSSAPSCRGLHSTKMTKPCQSFVPIAWMGTTRPQRPSIGRSSCGGEAKYLGALATASTTSVEDVLGSLVYCEVGTANSGMFQLTF